MNSAYPSPCDAGRYSDRNQSRTSSCFRACPEGYYCPTGTAQPIGCPANTYRGMVGARNESECEPCPLNTESKSGSRVCQFEACPAGFSSRNGKYSATPGATCKRCIERPTQPSPPLTRLALSLFMHPAPLHCDPSTPLFRHTGVRRGRSPVRTAARSAPLAPSPSTSTGPDKASASRAPGRCLRGRRARRTAPRSTPAQWRGPCS